MNEKEIAARSRLDILQHKRSTLTSRLQEVTDAIVQCEADLKNARQELYQHCLHDRYVLQPHMVCGIFGTFGPHRVCLDCGAVNEGLPCKYQSDPVMIEPNAECDEPCCAPHHQSAAASAAV